MVFFYHVPVTGRSVLTPQFIVLVGVAGQFAGLR